MKTNAFSENETHLSVQMLATLATINAQYNNTQKEIECLVQLYNKVQDASSQLLNLTNYDVVGSAYCLMGSYSLFMNNEDTRRVIADNAFYCLSKAIDKEPTKSLYIKRLLILAFFHKDFYYTIANAMEIPDDDIFDIPRMPLIIKTNQFYYDMAYHDFLQVGQTTYFEQNIEELYKLVKQTDNCNAQKGKECINKIINYLESVYKQY